MELVWKKENLTYGFREVGYTGRYRAFTIHFDGVSSNANPNKEKLTCNLHGMKNVLGKFLTVKEAKAYANKVLDQWLSGLEDTDNE